MAVLTLGLFGVAGVGSAGAAPQQRLPAEVTPAGGRVAAVGDGSGGALVVQAPVPASGASSSPIQRFRVDAQGTLVPGSRGTIAAAGRGDLSLARNTATGEYLLAYVGEEIRTLRLDPSGAPLGPPVTVAAVLRPAEAQLELIFSPASGGYVLAVARRTAASPPPSEDDFGVDEVVVRRLDASGAGVGDDVKVGPAPDPLRKGVTDPVLAVDPASGAILAGFSEPDGVPAEETGRGMVQRFDAALVPVGAPLRVSSSAGLALGWDPAGARWVVSFTRVDLQDAPCSGDSSSCDQPGKVQVRRQAVRTISPDGTLGREVVVPRSGEGSPTHVSIPPAGGTALAVFSGDGHTTLARIGLNGGVTASPAGPAFATYGPNEPFAAIATGARSALLLGVTDGGLPTGFPGATRARAFVTRLLPPETAKTPVVLAAKAPRTGRFPRVLRATASCAVACRMRIRVASCDGGLGSCRRVRASGAGSGSLRAGARRLTLSLTSANLRTLGTAGQLRIDVAAETPNGFEWLTRRYVGLRSPRP